MPVTGPNFVCPNLPHDEMILLKRAQYVSICTPLPFSKASGFGTQPRNILIKAHYDRLFLSAGGRNGWIKSSSVNDGWMKIHDRKRKKPIVNLVLGSHRGPDGGNLIARQGQDSALSMVLRRGRLDVIIKLDRTSFKSMPPPDVWRPPAVGVKVLTSPP